MYLFDNEDVLLVAKALVGARVQKSVSDRNLVALIGSPACGRSSLITVIVGLITAGSEYCLSFGFNTSEPLQSPYWYPVEHDTSPAYQNQLWMSPSSRFVLA